MERARERPAPAGRVPPGWARWTDGRAWFRDRVGEAGAAVHRLHRSGAADLHLKSGRGEAGRDVAAEAERLAWLQGRVPAPEFVAATQWGGRAWMLSATAPGRTAWQALGDDPAGRPALVAELARTLRALHALPVADCPFDSGWPVRLAHARARLEAGEIDTDDFGEAHAGWSAERLWRKIERLRPPAPDPVVTHGDFSLDNILVEAGRVTALIDLGRLGVADRWQDLAILHDCLGEFDDPSLPDAMLAAYGVARDGRKLAFHLALDECF